MDRSLGASINALTLLNKLHVVFPFTGDSFIVGTYSSKNEAHLLVYSIKESQGMREFRVWSSAVHP